LRPLASVEYPHPSRQFRRHVQDRFSVSDQALGDVPADPGAAFHRPDPFRELAAGTEHLLVAGGVRAEPALGEYLFLPVDGLDRCRSLVWIHPDHHTTHALRLLVRTQWTNAEEGNATCSWANPS
jgi:hypothetical protein